MTPRREAAFVVTLAVATTVAMTFPLAFRLGSGGRVDAEDGLFSIWNVAWVARTVVADPARLFDANIFFPHTDALAFSEANLVAGLLAVVPYWLTRNPYAAHNTVALLSFMLSLVGAYLLVRRLTGSRSAAAVSGVLFAFCPFAFARTGHIQLLMTAGLPFSMLAFHRFAHRPGVGRGVILGLMLAVTALACGYYGLFAALMVGVAILFHAVTDGRWANHRFWAGIAAAVVAGALVTGVCFLPYLDVGETHGRFARTLDDARMYSADWRAYLASSAHAHHWLLDRIERWNEVLFPGFLLLGLAAVGVATVRLPVHASTAPPARAGGSGRRPTCRGRRALRPDRTAGVVGIARTVHRALHGALRRGSGVRDAARAGAPRHRGGAIAVGAGRGGRHVARPRAPGILGHGPPHPGRAGRAGGGAVSTLRRATVPGRHPDVGTPPGRPGR